MKAKLLILFTLIFFTVSVQGQKAKDVLEDAIGMKNSQSILIKKADINNKTDAVLEYEILETGKIGILKDSLIFLVKGELVRIYIKPLNPLDYTFESKNELKTDIIDTEAADALRNIISYSSGIIKDLKSTNGLFKGLFPKSTTDSDSMSKCSTEFDSLNESLIKIKKKLSYDKKDTIATAFSTLKKMNFINPDTVKDNLDKVKEDIKFLDKYYSLIDNKISDLKEKIIGLDCNEVDYLFLIQNAFNQHIKDLVSVKKEQYKRVENLKIAFDAVEKVYEAASSNRVCDWCIEIKPSATLEKGKIASYTAELKRSGYRLATSSDKESSINEIIAEESNSITKKVFHFRKFKRFIPEVSSGIAYTNLDFPKYGAVTDEASGELQVAKIGNDNIKRINITAMLNFNYYVDHSDIHPFIQLGAGINTDFPTLLLGTGLRFNAFNGGRFAVSVGFAGSWIKSLDTLKIGDVVQDDSDVEKDIHYEFAKPKLYYGIQFNF